jgi:hypothetical protein
VTTLGELAQALGGVIRTTRGEQWLNTEVGGLRAVVICRSGWDPAERRIAEIVTANLA